MKYDLHIHTCLSPCADRAMTPATVAGMAKLSGAELIAVADHNSAANLPAVQAACAAYGLRLLPAIEACTAEEIHLLCYLPSVEAALELGEVFRRHLPPYPYDPSVWGEQWVMDEDDNILRREERLLTGALELDIYQTAALCRSHGGIPVPAHVDKDSYSLLSVFGLWDDSLGFELAELADLSRADALIQSGRLPDGLPLLTSSDAHALETMREEYPLLPDCALGRLL